MDRADLPMVNHHLHGFLYLTLIGGKEKNSFVFCFHNQKGPERTINITYTAVSRLMIEISSNKNAHLSTWFMATFLRKSAIAR